MKHSTTQQENGQVMAGTEMAVTGQPSTDRRSPDRRPPIPEVLVQVSVYALSDAAVTPRPGRLARALSTLGRRLPPKDLTATVVEAAPDADTPYQTADQPLPLSPADDLRSITIGGLTWTRPTSFGLWETERVASGYLHHEVRTWQQLRDSARPHPDVAGGEAEMVWAAAPTVLTAQPHTPPLTAAMRYRVRHQPYQHVDHVYESSGEEFFTQTATLVEALQLERVLEVYDSWHARQGEHDVEVWDGSAWSSAINPATLTAGGAFVQRLDDLDDEVSIDA